MLICLHEHLLAALVCLLLDVLGCLSETNLLLLSYEVGGPSTGSTSAMARLWPMIETLNADGLSLRDLGVLILYVLGEGVLATIIPLVMLSKHAPVFAHIHLSKLINARLIEQKRVANFGGSSLTNAATERIGRTFPPREVDLRFGGSRRRSAIDVLH
jgi:hypothetical protein